MMILKFSKKDKDFSEIKEQLKTHSLAFKTVKNTKIDHLILEDSDTEIIGKDAILQHLEKLRGELRQWYYCNC